MTPIFKKWPSIPRLQNEIFHFSEKIDGTNSCVIIKDYQEAIESGQYWFKIKTLDNYTIFAQSRNKLLTIDNDNFKFAQWVFDNAESLLNLGVGYHYGEWWGKGINTRYSIPEKRFSLFNTSLWNNQNKPECCDIVPYLGTCDINTLQEKIQQTKDLLHITGSYVDTNCKNPEGFIIFCELQQQYYKWILDK